MQSFYQKVFTRDQVCQIIASDNYNTKIQQLVMSRGIVQKQKKKGYIISALLRKVWQFCQKKKLSIQQRSLFLSLAEYITSYSISNKLQQFPSKQLLQKHILFQSTISCNNLFPLIDNLRGQQFLILMQQQFYNNYELYEMTLTNFTDFSLLTSKKKLHQQQKHTPAVQGKHVDPKSIPALSHYIKI